MQKLANRPVGMKPRAAATALVNEIIVISPEMAKAWLDKNANNRRRSAAQTASYARDMKANKWRLTGDPIRFDENGDLMDGQHRLQACVDAQVPFASVVIYGLPPETKAFLDMGKKRSVGDVLYMAGHHHVLVTAAIARLMMAHRDAVSGHSIRYSHAEILAMIDRHPGIHAAARETSGVLAPPRGMVGFVYYIGAFVLKEEERADAMLAVLKTGIPDYEGDPIHRLRERLLRKRDSVEILRKSDTLKGLMHAWNLFAKKQPVVNLKWGKDVTIDGLDLGKL